MGDLDEQDLQANNKLTKKTKKKKIIDDQEEEDMNFFEELYAGINNMFENVYDEAEEKIVGAPHVWLRRQI